MQRTVSIIIPVYNAEKYLAECLGNVVNQTLQNIEIILVNDASTDGSLTIMKECQRQYSDLVKLVNLLENVGAGGARNKGLEIAQGEYIGFVDSDDLIETGMYQKLYQKAKEADYDVVDSGYYKQSDDRAIIHTSDELAGEMNEEKRCQLIASGGYIVTKIFKRDLFEDKKLRFRTNVILEDSDFLTYLFAKIKKIGNVKEVLYFYRDNTASSSNEVDTEKYYINIYRAMQSIYEKLHLMLNYKQIREAVEYEILQMYSYGVNICMKAYLEGKSEGILEKLQKLAELKQKIVTCGYNNVFVKAKMQALDIEIMKLNDRGAAVLLNWLESRQEG